MVLNRRRLLSLLVFFSCLVGLWLQVLHFCNHGKADAPTVLVDVEESARLVVVQDSGSPTTTTTTATAGANGPCKKKVTSIVHEVLHGGSKHNLTVRSIVPGAGAASLSSDDEQCVVKNAVDVKDDTSGKRSPTDILRSQQSRADRRKSGMSMSMSRGGPKTKAPVVIFNETISFENYTAGRFNVFPSGTRDNDVWTPNFESFTLCQRCATKYFDKVCLWNGSIYKHEPTSMEYKSWSYAGDMIFPILDLATLPHELAPEFGDVPAVFAWMPCEGNLFHLIFQTLAPLYTLLVHQDLMGREAFHRKIDFFVDRPFGYDVVALRNDSTFRHGSCRSPKYLSIFDLLPVNLEYDYYGDDRFRGQLRCYKHAFFGFDERMDHGRMIPVLTYVKQKMIEQERCKKLASGPSQVNVILIQRHHRAVANMGELSDSLLRFGATLNVTFNVRAIALEDLSFSEQLELFSCWGDVMFGVQGAGMAWGYFMPQGKALVEVGWKKWDCRYEGRLKSHLQTTCIRVPDNAIKTNLTSYMKDTDIFKSQQYVKFNSFSELAEVDQRHVLEIVKKNPYNFVPKYADVTVPVSTFLNAIRSVVQSLK